MRTELRQFIGPMLSQDTAFQVKVEGLPVEEVFLEIVSALRQSELQVHVLLDQDAVGCRVVLVGGPKWSRAVAVHPNDQPGIVYLLKDNGKPIDLRRSVRPAETFWLQSGLLDGQGVGVVARFEPQLHRNARLAIKAQLSHSISLS